MNDQRNQENTYPTSDSDIPQSTSQTQSQTQKKNKKSKKNSSADDYQPE